MRKIRISTSGNELITLDEAKAFISFDDTDTEIDGLINDMIQSARMELENHFNISLTEQSVRVVIDDYDINYSKVTLPFSPISKNTITVKRYDRFGDETELTLNSHYNAVGLNDVDLILNDHIDGMNYVYIIEYDCGYGMSETEPLPTPFKEYVKLQVSHWFDNRDAYGDSSVALSNRAISKVLAYNKSNFI